MELFQTKTTLLGNRTTLPTKQKTREKMQDKIRMGGQNEENEKNQRVESK